MVLLPSVIHSCLKLIDLLLQFLQHHLRSSQRTSAVVTAGERTAADSGAARQSSTNAHTEAGPSSSSR